MIHFAGGSEIEGKNIEEGANRDQDQKRPTQPAKPNARSEQSHSRHFDLKATVRLAKRADYGRGQLIHVNGSSRSFRTKDKKVQ
jgi:hypothetical protein